MTVYSYCSRCRTPHPRGQRCATCPPNRGRDSSARGEQHRFRTAVLAAAGNRCQYVDPDGNRCPATTGLHAAHLHAYAGGGSWDPTNGVCLCTRHHAALDRRSV